MGPRLAIAIGIFCLVAAWIVQIEKISDITEKAIVQKTFSDAITHLGHESEGVIVEGIDSLLDLAKKNEDYRPKVWNILCAHVKTTTTAEGYKKKYRKQPSENIQKLLTSLFIDEKYRIFAVDPAEKKYRVDLSYAYLAGSKLSGAQLQDTDLRWAQLQGADLREAQLKGADLWGAQLQSAILINAKLRGADLRGAQLQSAILINAKLRGADLREAQLQGADLGEAQLQSAILINAELRGADLTGAQLQEADLRGAKLQGANLTEVQLRGAHLGYAQLQGADLTGANLQGTYLMKAQLQDTILTGAQLQGAFLKEAQLQGAKLQQAEMQGAGMHQTELPHKTQMGRSDLRGTDSSFELNPPFWNDSASKEGNQLEWFKKQLENFRTRIKGRIGQKADLAKVVFDEVNPDLATPQNEGTAKTGSYTKEEAEQWIKEYEEAFDWEKHQD